ncbi:MAG TPA: hypothetical protein VJ787_02635 [Thermoleophilia bacterium]|nr:hypothetical protein [Thermoleophilia bacterium]
MMLLEHDGPTEDRIAGALDEVRKSDNASSTLLADRLAAMLPGQPYTAVLAELAWAFKDFGKGVPVPVPKAPLLPPVTGVVPNATVVASELKDAHAALTGAMARMRDVVVALDAANEVPRDEAEAALDAALRSASRVREGLAAAALLSPTAVAEPATSADQLATIVARAAESLAALAAPTGRAHLERLADELRKGRIAATSPLRHRTLEKTRVAAVSEIERGLVASEDLDGFPGPPDDSPWLRWYWSSPGDAGHVESALDGKWDRIAEFLGSVQEADWNESPGPNEVAAATAAVTETPRDGTAPTSREAPPVEPPPATPPAAEPGDGALERAPAPLPDSEVRHSAPQEPPPAAPGGAAEVPASASTGSPPAPVPEATSGNTSGVAEPTLSMLPRTASSPGIRAALHFPTFDQFRRTHWVDRNDAVVAAPWGRADFAEGAFDAFLRAVVGDDWAQARLVLLALDRLGFSGAPRVVDFDVAAALCAGRWPPPDEEQIEAVTHLRHIHEQGQIQNDARHRLLVALAFAAPSAVRLLSPDEVEALTLLAGFCDRLRSFLIGWAEVARTLPDPFGTLSRQLRAGQAMSVDDLKRREEEARIALRSRLKELHSAAGNRIQRTHCRAGWDEFFIDARPHFEAAIASPAAPSVRIEIGRLRKKASKIFDRNEAKYGDRSSMDRAVDALIDAAETLFREFDGWRVATTASAAKEVFSASVTQLALSPTLSGASPDEPWLLKLFTRRLSKQVVSPTTVLAQGLVESHPWLLAAWPLGADALRSADVTQCLDPLTATAHLLGSPPVKDHDDDLRMWVFNEAPSLLGYFSDLNDRERSVVEDLRRKQRDALDGIISRLRRAQVDLAELADRDADALTSVMRDLEAETSSAKHNQTLLNAWGQFVLDAAEEHLALTLARVAEEAERAGVSREQVDVLRARRRFADLHVRAGKPAALAVARVRATPFRPDARQLWVDPRAAMARLSAELPSPGNESLRTLIRDWCHTSKHDSTPLGAEKQQALRENFVEVVFDATAQQRRKKVKPTKPAHRIACSDVAEWLTESAQAPSFLPQLHKFSDLIIKVAPVAATDRALPAKVLALGEEGSITIVLAPGLTEQGREDARRIARTTTAKPIVLLDDLDLCRLLNPGGQQPGLIEALVELAVEQQAWDEFGPYEVQEGQHVRMEMYVGRRPEADRLVTGTTYSRVFSGRRLGKTALLRYVEHKYDGSRMSSGNTLRVLYVPVVGLGSEGQVVAEIVEKLKAVTGVDLPSGDSPRDTLKAAVNAALAAKADDSFLVFLDEADTFFENQTGAPGRAGEEDSLSWAMRDIERVKDSRQHPRIRFVVCGYRATNRSEGAWGNWGDVLVLNPLEPSDAVHLVRGPLARLGIDAEDQADAIAFRCGYQPAVIIYFCARLLDELLRRTAFSDRERRVVRPEDVVSVFQLPEVQDRVRETCWLNFVGDPLGQLTFAAFLAESAELAPGTPIDDAPQRILSHVLRESEGKSIDGLGVGAWRDVGARHLRDLVKRALLTEADHHPLSLRLRFPHQLPILLQESPQERIRDALNRLGGSRPESARPQWLVPDDVLENARWCLGADGQELGVRGVVFGSHWSAPLLAGLQHRLPQGQLVTRLALPSDLDANGKSVALVGGADLLRAALRRQVEGGSAFEVVRLGRLTTDAIESYFKRERAIEFSSPGALRDIMKATSGIPALLGRLAVQFSEGATVTASQLGEAMRATSSSIPAVVNDLLSGPDDVRLQPREIELLHLLVAASTHAPDALREFLSDQDLLKQAAQQSPSLAARADVVEPLGPGDNERIALLLVLGLIPRRPLSEASGWALAEVAPIVAGDALHGVLQHLPVMPT